MNNRMPAIIYSQYGQPDVLHLEQMEKPTPKDSEILIKIQAVPVSFGDLMARDFKKITPARFSMPFLFWLASKAAIGFNRPNKQILGSEFSGLVEAVGKQVTRFKTGDAVFGYCGSNFGAYAGYLCVAENSSVTLKPTNMTFEEAAGVPYGALIALNLLKKVHIQPGQKVLILGASGGIGSGAVQLAKYYGAEVTGVCATPRLAYVKALGADRVIDYTKEDFTQNGETYDLILDILGKSAFSRVKGSLKQNGIYLLASFKMRQVFQMLWTSITGRKKVICALAFDKAEDLVFIKNLVEAGKYRTIIDRRFLLEQAADAHRYAESGDKKGAVILLASTAKI